MISDVKSIPDLIAWLILKESGRVVHAKKFPQIYQHSTNFLRFVGHPAAYTFHAVNDDTFSDSLNVNSDNEIVKITSPEVAITTIIDGIIETSNFIKLGDIIICGPKHEYYVLSKDKALTNYEFLYDASSNNNVTSMHTKSHLKPFIQVLREDFEKCSNLTSRSFSTSWGGTMIIDDGDFIGFEEQVISLINETLSSKMDATDARYKTLSSSLDSNIYRIERNIFPTTYELASSYEH